MMFGTATSRAAGTQVNWTGAAGTGNWSTAGNWASDPSGLGAAFSPNFAGTNQLDTTNSTFGALTRITFTATAGSFVLNGTGTGATVALSDRIDNLSTNLQTINFNISLAAVERFDAVANGTTVFNGIISGAGAPSINGGGTLGTNIFTAANTYSGLTTITEGVLNIQNSSGLGATNTGTTVLAGGELQLQGGISVGAEALSLSSIGSGGAATGGLRNISGDNTYGGLITLGAISRINSDSGTLSLTNAGTITGTFGLTLGGAGNIVLNSIIGTTTGTLTKDGAGTATLGAANTYTGLTTVSAGTLAYGTNNAISTGAVTVSGGVFDIGSFSDTVGTVTLTSGSITGSSGILTSTAAYAMQAGSVSANLAGGIGLNKTLAGTVVLSGSNSYTGATAISAGVLRAANNNALGTSAGGVTITSGAALELSNNIAIGAEAITMSGTGITSGGALRNVSGNNSYGGTITLGAATRINSDADTLTIDSAGNITGNFGLTFGGAGNIFLNDGFNPATAAQTVTKDGAGTLTLAAASTYTGATTISAGALRAANSTALGTIAGGVTVANGAALQLSDDISIGAEALTLNGDGIGSTGALRNVQGTNTYGGTITFATAATIEADADTQLNLTNTIGGNFLKTFDGPGNITASGAISGTAVGLTKIGAGTLTLSASNNYTGATTIGGGTLSVSADDNLGTAPGAATTGQLTMSNGGTLAVTTGFTLNSNRGIALGTGGGVFDIASGQALSYGGVITGANTLTKNGLGTLTLSGSSSYANTTVNAGTLNINNANALGNSAGTLTLGNGVTINNTSGSALTVLNAKSISIGSSLNFLGSNSLNLGTGTVTFTTNTTIDVAANVLRFDGDVIGSGLGLTKTGAGTLEFHGLTGSNSYTGNTFINGGKLFLTGTSIFGGTTNTTVTVASNAFLEIGTSASVGNVTVVSRPDGWINNATNVITADIVYDQSGTLTANNANYNGTTTIESGVTISTADDYFGVVPTNAVADRIILQNNATLQATASFDIEANQGVQLSSGTSTISSAGTNVALFVNSVVSGSGELRKTGTGNVRLLGTNTYTGGTVIDEGIIGIVADASLGDVSGRLKLNGGSVVAAQTISGPTNSGTTIDASRSLVLGNGTTSGLQAQTGLNLTYNGVIAEEGAGAAANVFIGTAGPRAGTVTLGGLNTFQGTTTLNAGVLEVATIANGGQASGLGQSGSAASNLVLNSGTLRFTGSSASTDRLFTVGGPAVTIDTGAGSLAFTNTGSLLFSSTNVSSTITLSGAGAGELAASVGDASGSNATALAKTGAGTWTLSGNGTFTGGTFLNEGTLRLASTTAAGSGSITQSNGSSTLVVDTTGTVANQMNVYNLTTLQTVTLSGAKTLFNATYNVTNNTTTTESGTLTGTGGITKTGTGTLLVTGDNSFSGAVDVQAGVLDLASTTGSAAGGTTSVSVSSGATLLISQSNQVNDAASVTLSGGTISRASGVSEVFGNLTVTGSSFLDFGTGTTGTVSFGTYAPSALLTVNNFFQGNVLTFGSDLTSTINNGGLFAFDNGFTSSWDSGTSTFTITAIPEPSTYLAAAGLLGMMLWPSRKRILRYAKRTLGLRAPMRDRLAARQA